MPAWRKANIELVYFYHTELMIPHYMTICHICQGNIWHNEFGDIMSNNLKLLRKSRGYTQIAVQMKTGIEQALLSKYETGERIPTTEALIKLADFYNVSIDYILCRTDNPEIRK